MPEQLTEKEAETMQVVVGLMRKSGYPPTMREVAEAMGVSVTLIALRFRALQFKGYIERKTSGSRAVRIKYDHAGAPFTY